MRITPVVLAGGRGERLWPLSTEAEPKQFAVKDEAGRSLFQATLLRVADRTQFSAPIIVCNHAHRFLVLDQLHDIHCSDARLILEPEGRNSAPAIALAALQVKDGVMLVLPSDHRIDATSQLLTAVEAARMAAAEGAIVTFAMQPTVAETGYGYIQYGEAMGDAGLRHIARFVEKPDKVTAEKFLRSGEYGWNSGIFLMSAQHVLVEFAMHAPEVMAACEAAYAEHLLDHSFLRPEVEAWRRCPSISFDYAVMEKTSRGAVMQVRMGWQDYGSWAAISEGAAVDALGNHTEGSVALLDMRDSYVEARGAHVAVIGLEGVVVIAQGNHVLIAPKERTQEVREVVRKLHSEPPKVTHRHWGQFRAIDRGDGYQVKQLCIRPGGKISLQTHASRSEHWVVVKGVATVTRGAQVFTLKENESTYIDAKQEHRLENRGEVELIVIEVQTGSYLGEDDITRLENAYPL